MLLEEYTSVVEGIDLVAVVEGMGVEACNVEDDDSWLDEAIGAVDTKDDVDDCTTVAVVTSVLEIDEVMVLWGGDDVVVEVVALVLGAGATMNSFVGKNVYCGPFETVDVGKNKLFEWAKRITWTLTLARYCIV
jgi:hypothetical protein